MLLHGYIHRTSICGVSIVTKLLIDGDVIAYRAGFAAEKSKYVVQKADGVGFTPESWTHFDDAKAAKDFGDDPTLFRMWSRKEVQPVEQAILIADVMIKDIRERYAAENPSVVVFLSGVGNFRNSIATRASYKGNRSGAVPPVHLKAIRQHLIDRGAIVSQGEEADDLLGIAMTDNPDAVCCSIDKDLKSIPGRHYNFVTKEEVNVTPKAACINFYSQVLSGDSVDNVPGLTGVGPVKAQKALASCNNPAECWLAALQLYTNEFGPNKGPQYALEAARLVYVRRKVGEVWSPPSTRSLANETKKTETQRNAEESSQGGISQRTGEVDSGRSDGKRTGVRI